MSEQPFNVKLVLYALLEAGGEADLREIYANVERLLPNWSEQYKNEQSFRATVRHTIESYCPQSENYARDHEAWFERVARGRYRLVPPEHRAALIGRGRTL